MLVTFICTKLVIELLNNVIKVVIELKCNRLLKLYMLLSKTTTDVFGSSSVKSERESGT